MAVYGEIAAYLAYDMFSKCEYLIVNLVFPPRCLEWGFFLIAPFSEHCLLVQRMFMVYYVIVTVLLSKICLKTKATCVYLVVLGAIRLLRFIFIHCDSILSFFYNIP